MMKHILALSLCLLGMFCYSQSIIFTYDAVGNRLTRTYDNTSVKPEGSDSMQVTVDNNSSNAVEENESAKLSLKEALASSENFIYPNPAKNSLDIYLGDLYKSEVPQSLELVDLRGKIVLTMDVKAASSTLNLQGCRKGMYYVHFKEKGMVKQSWKMVKID